MFYYSTLRDMERDEMVLEANCCDYTPYFVLCTQSFDDQFRYFNLHRSTPYVLLRLFMPFEARTVYFVLLRVQCIRSTVWDTKCSPYCTSNMSTAVQYAADDLLHNYISMYGVHGLDM